MENKQNNLAIGEIILYLYTIFLTFVSLVPTDRIDNIELILSDKAAHILLYLIFAYLLTRLCLKRWGGTFTAYATLTIGSLYGVLLEFLQNLVPGRNFEWFDIMANYVGFMCGILAYHLTTKCMTR